MPSISPRDLQARLSRNEAVQLIDVREFAEFAAGRIAGARLLPLAEIESRATRCHTHQFLSTVQQAMVSHSGVERPTLIA